MLFRGKKLTVEDELHIREHQEALRRVSYHLYGETDEEKELISQIVNRSNLLAFRFEDLLQMSRKLEAEEITARSQTS